MSRARPARPAEYLAALDPEKRAALQRLRRMHHCSFFPGAYPIAVCKADLKGYHTSKGTVRFTPSQPLPATLVRKLVKARATEVARRRASRRDRARTPRGR